MQRLVKVGINRSAWPGRADVSKPIKLRGTQIRLFDFGSVDRCEIIERHVFTAYDRIMHAVCDYIAVRSIYQQELGR